MRKIVISFVVSIVVTIAGGCIFGFECSQIQTKDVTISSTSTKKTITLDPSKSNLEVDDLIETVDDSSCGYYTIDLKDCILDSTLNPYEVVVEYNDKFDCHISQSDDKTLISFDSDYTWDEEDSSWYNFSGFIKSWQTKTFTVNNFSSDFFDVNIRYGSKVNLSTINYDQVE